MSESNDNREQPGSATEPVVPFRQIRALYDSDTITVYQAYNQDIASEAVAHQKLDASPLFSPGRMTWVKPSWCWMMYRAGYSYKDKNQERILAIKMKHEDFLRLLEKGVLSDTHGENRSASQRKDSGSRRGKKTTEADIETRHKTTGVRIQWDPERSARLDRLDYRSIQIGIPGGLRSDWIDNWIFSIEDVTERARELRRVLEVEPSITDQELAERGLVPEEREFEVSDDLRATLEMG